MEQELKALCNLANRGHPEYLDDYVNRKRSVEHQGGTYTIQDWFKENKIKLNNFKNR